jgi:hypothetical protein
MIGIFLLGEDTIEAVKSIRKDALAGLRSGEVVSWSSESTTVTKVLNMKLKDVIAECNYFLRQVDPTIRKNNPMRDVTRPFIVC